MSLFFFQPSMLDLLEVGFHNFFRFTFMNLSQSHDPSCGFNKLTRVESSYFFGLLFLIDFFISSFNIGLVGN